MSTGPRSKTIRNKKRRVNFKILKKGILIRMDKLTGKVLSPTNKVVLSDSDVRKIRDWMNWYLDNK